MNRKRTCSNLWLYFAGIVFATIFAVLTVLAVVWTILFRTGVVSLDPHERRIPLLVSLLGSLLIGSVIAFFVGRLIIRPVKGISNAFDELSHGNFSVRVPETERIAEIREMAKKFNAMAHDLSHIETLRNDFVANVSHEFKTPLSAIEGYIMLLQNHNLSPEKQDAYVEKILENSHRLSALSNNILLLSKLENQEIVPGGGEYRLDEQIRRTILMLERKWTEKQIDFDIELPKQMIWGNEALLEQVWSNLVDNAVKYSPAGSTIHIRAEGDNDTVSVTIADEGIGMNEEVRKHLFEKFYQGDPSHSGEGNGLGLALVRRIVDLCGGEIAVSSEEGHGSAFTVRLPKEL